MTIKEHIFELQTLLACRGDDTLTHKQISLESAIWHVKGNIRSKLNKMYLKGRLSLQGLDYIRFKKKLDRFSDKWELAVDNRITNVQTKSVTVNEVKRGLLQ